jgi:hypothetical protein
VAEIDLPGRRDDLKVLVGSDGKLIKTRKKERPSSKSMAMMPSYSTLCSQNRVDFICSNDGAGVEKTHHHHPDSAQWN